MARILDMYTGVTQGSVLGSLVFLHYINNLHHAIKYCKVHHLANGAKFLYFSKSIKHLNKYINNDIKYQVNWFNATKISLNGKNRNGHLQNEK